jgi:hypothetical protein
LLIVLPYLGLGLSAFSAIWGLTHELYTKDENNTRHLTKEGKYAVAVTLLGLLISLNTGVLKVITDGQKKARDDQEAARNELKDFTRQQEEAARIQTLQDTARQTKEDLANSSEAQRYRELLIAQHQLEGFNNAERLARQQTLAELQRSNGILWSIRKSQYPITDEFKMQPVVRIAVSHPLLKAHAEESKVEARRRVELHRQGGPAAPAVYPDKTGDLVTPVYQDSYLFTDPEGMPSILMSIDLGVSIYRGGRNIDSAEADIGFIYFTSIGGPAQNPGVPAGTVDYSISSSTYRVAGPRIAPAPALFSSSGKMTSLLDLPGSTMVIKCRRVETRTGCRDMSLDSILFEFPPGIQIQIRGFTHEIIKGEDQLIHVFATDEEKFLEKYAPR